jgi:hypothetical protein
VPPADFSGVDAFAAQWVHLRLRRGRQALLELHDRLYRGVLAPFLRDDLDHEPPLTVGCASDAAACATMLREAKARLRAPIEASVGSPRIVQLRADGRVDGGADIPLGAA